MPRSDRAVTSAAEQGGGALLLFVVGLLLAAATIFAVMLFGPSGRGARQAEATASSFQTLQAAISAYVAVNGHLPCPANPAPANDGLADPPPPAATCNTANGVVPWRTLGVPPEAALDGWNRRISYRVADGPTGLTQSDGASMVNCDSFYPYGAPPALPANGLCTAALHANTEDQFLAGKGLTVNDAGNLLSGVAFVLISHGESGYGAWLPGGGRMPMPASAEELANSGGASPFYSKAHSLPATDPAAVAHFDDVVSWTSIRDLARKSGRAGRDWQDSGATVQISPETTLNMNTPSSGAFNASGNLPVAATDTDADSRVDALAFIAAGAGSGAACIWWPKSFKVFDGSARYSLRVVLEFASTSANNDFAGFTLGFMAKNATDAAGKLFTELCGDTSSSASLGWSNGVALPAPGNIPPPRFAAEFDTAQDATSSDPPANHLAVDFNDVRHDGVSAAACSLTPDSYHLGATGNDCYTGPGTTWLRDGLSNYQRLRIEVLPRDPTCPGVAPRVKTWVIPRDVCQGGLATAFCASAKDLLQTFAPTAPLPTGVVAIESCVPPPVPGTQFDELYFGLTASALAGANGTLLSIRNLGAAALPAP